MGRVALIFGLSKERRGSIPAAGDRGATPLRTKSSATRRANEIWAVWRRCALLTDHRGGGGESWRSAGGRASGYARPLRVAIRPKAHSRGSYLLFRRPLRRVTVNWSH